MITRSKLEKIISDEIKENNAERIINLIDSYSYGLIETAFPKKETAGKIHLDRIIVDTFYGMRLFHIDHMSTRLYNVIYRKMKNAPQNKDKEYIQYSMRDIINEVQTFYILFRLKDLGRCSVNEFIDILNYFYDFEIPGFQSDDIKIMDFYKHNN